MNSLYNAPLYYISFNKNKDIENYYHRIGFKNVNHFKAVDGRKFNAKKLLEDNIISIRCYHDLVYGRTQDSGMPSLGGIGCTMSHFNIWKYCVDKNFPYIIITEDDNKFIDGISKNDEKNILDCVSSENGIFVGENLNMIKSVDSVDNIHFFGTQFCVVSKEACKILMYNCFPIDIQTDAYIAHIANMGYINLKGYKMSEQKLHTSSVQSNISDVWKYCMEYIIILIIILLCLSIYYNYRYRLCLTTGK
jgi:GR25 family glycosyltransferase involved in LPS biosynthesis